MADFKDIFIDLRKQNKYTQEDISKKLGVSASTIGMWETGKRTPTRAKYEEIADLFNVDIDFLYGKTDIKRRVIYDEYGNEYTPSTPSLSNDENTLINDYRTLNHEGKMKAREYVSDLTGNEKYKKDTMLLREA